METRIATETADLIAMRRLATDVQAESWPANARWHPGDVSWYWFQNMHHGQNTFAVWEAGGKLEAMACIWADGSGVGVLSPCAFPASSGLKHLFEWVLGWQKSSNATLIQQVLETDRSMIAEVEARGFRFNGDVEYLMTRDLGMPVESSPISAYSVLSENQFLQRLSVQHEEWHPWLTTNLYAVLRQMPGYSAQLDRVALTESGAGAAYGIAWLDDVNGIGMFDPVATRAAHRRKGYGRSVMLALCSQLQAMGARRARVQCGEHNLGFYESAGFRVSERWLSFERRSS